jgi:hypothetical protein
LSDLPVLDKPRELIRPCIGIVGECLADPIERWHDNFKLLVRLNEVRARNLHGIRLHVGSVLPAT